ncbi:AAA family ATPase [Haloferacaceae archaeon DSL9]
MRVLGTVGLPGSGKGEAAAVARESGIPVVTMGDVIRRACLDRGFDPAEHHGEMAQTLREEEGVAAIAERSLPLVRDALADADAVLVDGLRSMAEVDRFEAAFGDAFVLVSVEAPFDVRAERLANRGRDSSDNDLERLRARDERELGFGMGEVIDNADVRVENTDSLESFRRAIRRVLDSEPEEVDA